MAPVASSMSSPSVLPSARTTSRRVGAISATSPSRAALLAQDVPQRRGNIRRGQTGGDRRRRLDMAVARTMAFLAVDQGDADAGIVERTGRAHPAAAQ
ncbi:hypothetical protein BER92_00200 [Xanthomonas fragariae]|nr:hypothetical protein BER92_00200 [Xanthomonas fragariae]